MIEIFVQSRYSVNRTLIRKRVLDYFKKTGIDPTQYTVSIAIIGDRKMRYVHQKYGKKEGTTPVLSFNLQSASVKYKTIIPRDSLNPTGPILLGEIVISYPQAIIFASEENKLLDVKIGDFVEHGLSKLLGIGI